MRKGFTLLETLVATAIFVVVGGAMISVFAASVELYRVGESARVAGDESMAVIGRIDADIARALPAAQGGFIFARALSTSGGEANGHSSLGLVIQSQEDPSQQDLVVWDVDEATPLPNLRRRVYRHINRARLISLYNQGNGNIDDLAGADIDTGKTPADIQVTTITTGVLHFGISLAGTGRKDSSAWAIPEDDYWTTAEPLPGLPPYSNLPQNDGSDSIYRYPTAVRVSLVLSGSRGDRFTRRARVMADNGSTITVAGGSVPNLPGSLARVGNELIAFHSGSNKVLRINDSQGSNSGWTQGPVRANFDPSGSFVNYGDGRAVYRSTEPSGGHSRGDWIYFGSQFVMIRNLP